MNEPVRLRGFGRYHLERLIGRGGMGEIYMARMEGPRGFRKQVCIKKILPHLAQEAEFVARFIDEANIVVSLTHGNIVPVFDMGEVDGQYFIAMEYIPGRDLRDIMKRYESRDERATLPIALYVVKETCKGLGYAHKKTDDAGSSLNIVHRDVSPSNILVSREGVVKLTDFGIAKAVSKLGKSITGRLQGKFCYMSPEQAAGKSVTYRSDIFSLGSVAYELITGVRPFEGSTDMATLDLVRAAKSEPPSKHLEDLPKELDDVLLKALARDPDDRYEEISQFAAALVDVVGVRGVASESEMSEELTRIYPLDELTDGTPARGLPLDEVLALEADRILMGEAPTLTRTATADSLLKMPDVADSELLPTPYPIDLRVTPSPAANQSTPYPASSSMDVVVQGGRRSVVLWLILAALVAATIIIVPNLSRDVEPPIPLPSLRVECLDIEGEAIVGARILVDNVFRGRCPVELPMEVGEYIIDVAAERYSNARQFVTVTAGGPNEITFVMSVATVQATVVLSPPTALFSFDQGGQWHVSGETVLIEPGEYQVLAQADGYQSREFIYHFGGGEPLDVTLDELVAVVVPDGTGSDTESPDDPITPDPDNTDDNEDGGSDREPDEVSVWVYSDPDGAIISVNGDQFGTAPLDLSFDSDAQAQVIRAELVGYEAAEETFHPHRRNRPRAITLILTAPENPCGVHIWLPATTPGSPAIGDVYVNDILHPDPAPTTIQLAPGHYLIRVVNQDAGADDDEEIEITEDTICPIRVRFDL